jgi:hypothetical protein
MDRESRSLDAKILDFVRRDGEKPALEKEFEALSFRIFEYQFRRNENYRKFCLLEDRPPRRVSHWKDIPAMPTVGFKELVLSSFPIRRAAKVFRTSGTTLGSEGRGAHFFDTLRLYDAVTVPVFKKYLLPDTDRMPLFFLMPSSAEAPDSSLSYMMGVVRRKFSVGPGRFYVNKERILCRELLRDLKAAKKQVMILATAFSLKAFLDWMGGERVSLNLKPGSRVMETGGFKGKTREISKAALYRDCRRYLGIPRSFCVSEYGMTELSSQFYDTTLADYSTGLRRKPFKEGPSWVRTLVIDPRTGRESKRGSKGVLRHFDLANRGSVMAVQTEDLGVARETGFELLGRLPGADLRGCSLTYEAFLKS